jgi:hypothetical protein
MKRIFVSDLAEHQRPEEQRAKRSKIFAECFSSPNGTHQRLKRSSLCSHLKCLRAAKELSNIDRAKPHTSSHAAVAKRKTRASCRCLRRDPLTPRRRENFNIVKLLSRLSLRWCFSRGEHFFFECKTENFPLESIAARKRNFSRKILIKERKVEGRKGLEWISASFPVA